MRPVRKFPRSSQLFLLGFVFLILSLATYIGFTEKYPYSHLINVHYAYKISLFDIQESTLEATKQNIFKLPNTKIGPSSSPLKKDAVKRLATYHELYVHEKQTQLQKPSESFQNESRNKLVIVEAYQKPTEKKQRPSSNEIHPKDSNERPAAASNKKDERNITPTSHEEEAREMVSGRNGKEGPKAKYVAPTSNKKQAMGRDATTAASQQQFQATNATLPSRAKQTHQRKQPNKVDLTKEHLTRTPEPEIQQATHLVSLATLPKRLKASDFKSEPHWDFEDEYLLDNSTPPSSCPNSLRIKAAKSDWLKNVFLPNITVFMDRSHFSDSEWKRMEHFAPPFGFMELNFSLVKEVLTMLSPKPYHQVLFAHNSHQASRCITCAVVGNGGILNNSRMGQEIDAHDYVFRVSGAVTKGYENDVGTRTDFYGFTAYSLMSSIMILGNRGFKKIPIGKEIKYLHFLEGTRDYEWLKALLLNTKVRKGFLDYYGPKPRDKFDNFSLDKYFVIHPDFLRYVKNRFLKSKSLEKSYWRIYRPTTGAFLLLTALHLCDQVSAYGYITEGYQKYSDHYYDKEWKRLIFYSNHDFDLERKVWKKLHDANMMKLYQRI